MAKILITGGTGLIGKHLSQQLAEMGHEVVLLSRDPNQSRSAFKVFEWNVASGFINEKAFEGIEHIVHLAGEGIADKNWSDERKEQLIDSRVQSAQLIATYLLKLNIKLKSFVGASAVGYYGANTSDTIFKETDKSANDFLGNVCKVWEESYEPIKKLGIPCSIIRIGVVLAKEGGALPKMMMPFKFGIGSALGSGKQWMPWIHIEDLAGVFVNALFEKIPFGTYNAVTSHHITNHDLSKTLASVMHKPFFAPKVPAFILKLIFGEMSAVVLEGSRVSNEKLIQAGFEFKHTEIESCLKDLLK